MLQTLKTQYTNYIKLKKADSGKQSFSKLTGSGSFYQIRIRPDPETDLGSGRSLVFSSTTANLNYDLQF